MSMKVILIILSLAGGNPTVIQGFSSMATCEAAVAQITTLGDRHQERCMEIK